MLLVVILRLRKWWGYVGRWVRVGVTNVIDVIKLWVAGCCFWPEGPLHAIKCSSPSPKVFSWDSQPLMVQSWHAYVDWKHRCHKGVCLRKECPQIPWFINILINQLKYAILGTPPFLAKPGWCFGVITRCYPCLQDARTLTIEEWWIELMGGKHWKVSDNSWRIWKSTRTLTYTFRFQSLSSKDTQSKTTVLSDFVVHFWQRCVWCLRAIITWQENDEGERERDRASNGNWTLNTWCLQSD